MRKETEMNLIRNNQEFLLKTKKIIFTNLMNDYDCKDSSFFKINPDKLYKIHEFENAFYNFKQESDNKRDMLEGFCSRISKFVKNLFPVIETKIMKKKNRYLAESMKSSLTLYFIYQSMLKLEEALEEVAEFFEILIQLFELWSVGQSGINSKFMNFLYLNFSKMSFKRMQKLSMRVFLLGKSGFDDMNKVYEELHQKLVEIQYNYISSNNKNMNSIEESWEKVKLIDPKMKPEDRWTEYKMLFPVNFYEDKINQQIIGKKFKEWYLRPHHIETVTEHPKSIKDNVLNPKYYSQLNNEEPGEFEESFEQWKERKGCRFKMSNRENDIRRNIYKTDKLIRNIQNARKILQNRNNYLDCVSMESESKSFDLEIVMK
jgi:hypothetical protein